MIKQESNKTNKKEVISTLKNLGLGAKPQNHITEDIISLKEYQQMSIKLNNIIIHNKTKKYQL
jgi:predicted transcriptional regulator